MNNEINDDMYIAVARAMCKEIDYKVVLPGNIDDRYTYILENHLITPLNRIEFTHQVRRVYLEIAELLYDEQRDEYPSIADVTTLIDEENMLIIEHFFSEYEYDNRDIDLIVTKYTMEVSPLLSDEIKMTLRNLGFAFKSNDVLTDEDIRLVSGPLDPSQQVLLYDFFY